VGQRGDGGEGVEPDLRDGIGRLLGEQADVGKRSGSNAVRGSMIVGSNPAIRAIGASAWPDVDGADQDQPRRRQLDREEEAPSVGLDRAGGARPEAGGEHFGERIAGSPRPTTSGPRRSPAR
jgi:hypothetical protein